MDRTIKSAKTTVRAATWAAVVAAEVARGMAWAANNSNFDELIKKALEEKKKDDNTVPN